MGYDVDPEARTLSAYLAARAEAQAAGSDVLTGEVALIELFADLAELSRNRPVGAEAQTELRILSDREHFHRYLTTLDVDRAGLQEQFVERLTRVLRHYGVDSLDRTPQLEEAVFRVFLAQKRVAADVPIVLGILDRWLSEPAPEDGRASSARADLERILRATQLRFPAVGDLTRSVRFRWFDQPQVDAERESILSGLGQEVAALAADPAAADYADRVRTLAGIHEWTATYLARHLRAGVPAVEPMLEVLLHKYYSEYQLRDVHRLELDGRAAVIADYVLEGRPRRFVTTVGTLDELAADGPLERLVAEQFALREPGEDAVCELDVRADEDLGDDAMGDLLAERLRAWTWGPEVKRIAVGVCTDDVSYYTFRFDENGALTEDTRVRGAHPMAGRRLDLWRLRRTSGCSSASRSRTPATGALSPWRRSASSRPYATPTATCWRSRTPNARSRTASRPSVAPEPRAARPAASST
jgi:hypothetical protein